MIVGFLRWTEFMGGTGGMAPDGFFDACYVGHYADAEDEGTYTDVSNVMEAIALVCFGDRTARV
jgi:hypothetical protein